MTEQITAANLTAPDKNGRPALPKRNAPKGMLPLSWLARTVRLEYVGAAGDARETSGTLLDFYPTGVIIGIKSARTLIAWDRLATLELVED